MKSAIATFVIALYALLPFYEVVDYNEHWPNDGHLVAVIFTILFIVEIRRILHKVDAICPVFLQNIWQFALDPCPAVSFDRSALPGSTGTPLFLRLCDFRI